MLAYYNVEGIKKRKRIIKDFDLSIQKSTELYDLLYSLHQNFKKLLLLFEKVFN